MKKTRCNLGDCVTVDIDPDGVTVGDTKTGCTLWFDHAEWAAFLAGVRAGEFDLPGTRATGPLKRLRLTVREWRHEKVKARRDGGEYPIIDRPLTLLEHWARTRR